MPSFFSSHQLQTRIVSLYLGLFLIVVTVGSWVINWDINRSARVTIGAELTTGERVFLRLLGQNSINLTQAARILSADQSFRAAVTNGEQAAMQAMLANSSQASGATLAIITDEQFQLKASSTNSTPKALRMLAAVQRHARQAGDGGAQQTQIEILDGEPYQLVTVPVRTPQTVAWVALAMTLDRHVLQDMSHVSGVEVALLLRQTDGDWRVATATMDPATWPAVATSWERPLNAGDINGTAIRVANTEYSARPVSLQGTAGQAPTTALLMRSVSQALVPYEGLKYTLLMLAAAGVVIFLLGGMVTARLITNPLRLLSASARRLERGDYGAEVRASIKGEIGELAQSFETMRKAIQTREGEIRRLAYQDALTDLPNREQFRHDLRQAIGKASSDGTPCSVVLLDMDRFKHVNDVLGHRFGDRLLRAVAERLRHDALNERDILARLSGDEFAILLHATNAKAAYPVAQRIMAAFERPITLDDHTVDLGAGIGVASSPEHGVDADTLLSRAEVAMYAAKQQQSGTVTYHPGLDSTSEESLTMLSELRSAVDHNQLRLYLQPKINLRSGQVLGAEALVRWQHPTRGLVPPMHFIPFAEQTGFVRVLTMWMIEQVAQMSHAPTAQGLRMKLAVNLSTRDLMDQDLPNKLDKVLTRYAIDPSLLVLEITESAIMDDPQRALQTLNRLHAMGLKLSIDDFGTGYSSLAYLKRLPVDELKIDKSFVMNMESDLQDAKIVHSTIDLAHNLGLSVVAEGIESAMSWKLLDQLSCDEAQGFFIAKPMPSAQFAAWVQQWTPPDTTHEHLATEFAGMG